MTPADNKAITRRFAEVWNTGALAAVADYVAADYVRHDTGLPMQIRGQEGVRQLISIYRGAFPDLHFKAEVLFADDEHVAARWQVSGTHQGELLGIPPTGKALAISATDLYRIAEGKIAEQWVQVDNLGLFQQLGVVPVLG